MSVCFVYRCENHSKNELPGGIFLNEKVWMCNPCLEFLMSGENKKHRFCQIRRNVDSLEIETCEKSIK